MLQVLLSRQKETRSYESWKCLSAPAAGGGIQNWSLGWDPMNRRMGEVVWSRAAQCIDKEILISKNGNIDIDIEIDKRMFW